MIKKKNQTNQIRNLSTHLFWDVDTSKLTFEKNETLIVQRVLEYGNLEDWNFLKSTYGLEKIAFVATKLRTLDEVALHFISTICSIPLESFRCYSKQQSHPNFYGY